MAGQEVVPPAFIGGTAPDLTLHGLGFRFADAEVERRYHAWSIDRKIPLIRVGMLASAAGYAVYLLAVVLLVPDDFGKIYPTVAAFLGFLTFIFASTFFPAMRSLVVPMTVLGNCISGFLLAYQIHELIATPDRFAIAATAVLIPVMFGYCVYQLRPSLATLATVPFILLTLYLLYLDHEMGRISSIVAGGLAAMLFISCNTGVFVCSVIEIGNRRTFRKDQIIDLQRLQLSESRDAIRRYMPPAVADRIIRGEAQSIDTPVRRRVTIMFADLVGFTEISDRIDPEDLTTLLVDFLSGMASTIESFGGTINEFKGDGVMALFGAPDHQEPELQARQAIAAARGMQTLLAQLNERWLKLGIGRHLMMRIGINTGTVSVGSYGSRGRMTYTAMGLETNITARIEQSAEPGTVLVSDSTYQLARHAFNLQPRGGVECKGLQNPVLVYALVNEPPGTE
ncbi:MAG TPA: adenylate/guanylate cyclase domain-containing protein [Nevskiaceae bacterium]|nr:adenylate/guanylate cyclase domain-containing protein [Nevskiaceae bacterium]